MSISVERGPDSQTLEDREARAFIRVLKSGGNVRALVHPIGGGPIIEPNDLLEFLSLCAPIRKMAATTKAAAKAKAAKVFNTCCVILGAHAASVVKSSQDPLFKASYTKSVMECCFGKVNWGPHIAGYSSFTSGTGAHFLLHAGIVKMLRDLSTERLYDSLTDDALIAEINRCITTSQNEFKKSVEKRVLFDGAGNFSVGSCYKGVEGGITKSASFLKELFIKDNLYELRIVDEKQRASFINPHRVVTINLNGDPYPDEHGNLGVTDDIVLNILFKIKVVLEDGSVFIIPLSFDRKAFRERHRVPGSESPGNIHFLSFELIEYLLTNHMFMRVTLPSLLLAQFQTKPDYFSYCNEKQLDQITRSLVNNPTSLCVCDIGCKGVGALIEGALLRTIDDQQQYGYTDSDGTPVIFQFGDDNKIKEMLVFGDSFLRNPHGLKMAETYSDSRHTVVNSALRVEVGKEFDSLGREWSDSPPAYLSSPSQSPAWSLEPEETQAKIESEYSGSKQSVEKLLGRSSAEAGAGGGMAESLPVVSSYRKSLAQLFFNAIHWFRTPTKCVGVGDMEQEGGGGAGRKSRKLRRGRSFGRMKPRTSRRSRRRSRRRSSKN